MISAPSHQKTGAPPQRQHLKKGFTLLELLVSISILSILILVLAQVSSMVANTWSSGNARADRRANGRSLVDFIARELRSASLPVAQPRDAAGNIMTDYPDLQFVHNPPTVSGGPNGFKYPHAIFWQAPIANDLSAGDLATIGYFVRWDTSTSTPRAMLCRYFVNPNDPAYTIYDNASQWITDTTLDAVAPGDNKTPSNATQPNAYRGLFADNVIAFWAQCHDASGNIIDATTATTTTASTKSFDSRVDYTGADSSGEPKTYTAPTLPHSVDVAFVLVDSRTAALFTPAIMGEIKALSNNLAATSASSATFLEALQTSPSLKRIAQGATAHRLRVYLDNAP
ncbi:prepilin-type N-terminal cleavage/methylation domain-containing protein [Phragmitibacter flavus]|uniref:Prepilin-type N-terminal cleavage/methylation domain-containing protein n=1 Tax=Phragmitibacter flavus TaxID=2576071 RepID=A0A5R8KBG0_9BACT|nr:prepilin-type N-terminal cleavage/methylation domain-containing protein [Phragmitibacter flavus]TLD68889.1 prepilin-type N-terminal cleavage/methylation domain-containing protein [Phragmitibacter flavus]